ncbi:MAG TPA: Rne/Rng family ribonuclease [Gemmataceae bacterium]|jgi:ribonuclease E|nr:Rne/Rng family ribonuclease [Gemmataceae bacterium]
MKKEMLINVLQPEECRIAIVEDGILEELYVERSSQESYVGNIYKGRIVNIEPSIQAAFVDFGIGRNGFLHVSDVEPAYYRHLEEQQESEGRRRGRDRGRSEPQQRQSEYDVDDLMAPDEPNAPLGVHDATPPENIAVVPATAPGTGDEKKKEEPRSKRGGRGRGNSRGRGRRRGGERPEGAPPEGAEGAAGADPFTMSAPDASTQESAPPPREPGADDSPYMSSAEHRTDKDSSEQKDSQSDSGIEDELCFQPREAKRPAQATPPPAVEESFQPTEAEPTFGTEPESTFVMEERDYESESVVSEESNAHDFSSEPEEPVHPDDAPMDSEKFVEEDLHESLDQYTRPRRRPSGGGGGGRRDRGDRGGDRGGERGPRRGGPGGGSRGGPRRPMMGRSAIGRPKPLIQDIFKRGQEVLVQVIKEGIGTKGPTLSTYISIAGRYLVLMPGLNRVGVSRKIDDEEARRRLRDIFHELQPPKGLGFIIRTAGMDKTKKELQRDLAYLVRLWQVVVRRITKIKAPAEIYQESDMITRTIRDTFSNDIDTIWVDEPTAFEHAQEFLQIVMPRYAPRIKLFGDTEPLFHRYGIEEEIARIQRRKVPLPAGGSIVIDQTEALVAIDVNSGNFRADNNAEETAYQMNLQAAKEIARQLRLRDLGGVIVNDFIDMREDKHRRNVELALRDAVKRDRARTKVLRISQFGLIEMTRQRIRPSLKRSVYQDCPACGGTSQVKTTESMSIDVMRLLQLATHRQQIERVVVRVQEEVERYLLNRKRKEITKLEEAGNAQVTIHSVPEVSPEFLEFTCFDANGNEVKFAPYEETARVPRRR